MLNLRKIQLFVAVQNVAALTIFRLLPFLTQLRFVFVVLTVEVANQSHDFKRVLEQRLRLGQKSIVKSFFKQSCIQTSRFDPAQICIKVTDAPKLRLSQGRLTAPTGGGLEVLELFTFGC